MNVVEMCLEKISASVRCFGAAFMPGTSLARTPVFANVSRVMFNMAFVLLDAIKGTQRRALWPIASKISDQHLLKINIGGRKRRRATVGLEYWIGEIPGELKLCAQAGK